MERIRKYLQDEGVLDEYGNKKEDIIMTTKKKTVKETATKKVAPKKTTKVVAKKEAVVEVLDKVIEAQEAKVASKIKTFVESKYGPKQFNNEVAYGIYSHIMMQVNEVFEKQPNSIGFDKNVLDNFVSAPAHGSLHNAKKYIKCNATDSDTINQWAQHMAVILADELRVALTRTIFKADSIKG